MNFIKRWKKTGWKQITASEYAEIYQQYGGSFAMHPRVIGTYGQVTKMETTYYGFFEGTTIKGAAPVWGQWIAGQKPPLKKSALRRLIDTGNAEVIFPFDPDTSFFLPFHCHLVSEKHYPQIENLKPEKNGNISLAKPHKGGLSKKFKYNHRRMQRLIEEAGGSIEPITNLNNWEIAETYKDLFKKRFGFFPKGNERLETVLDDWRPFLFGYLLRMKGRVIAIQIVYLTETKHFISAEYINGGVDTDFNAYSPGSILYFLNTQKAFDISDARGKELRYSFGLADKEYKERWCNPHPLYKTS